MRIAETQLVRAVEQLREEGMTPHELSRALMRFLQRKHLMKRSTKILRSLETYTLEQAGRVMVDATIAHAPSDTIKQQVEEKAEALFGGKGKKVKVTFHQNPQLIGGVRLETTTTRYDFSLRRTIIDLHKSLVK